MDSYVVRIYRRPGRKSHILIGTVEVAGTDLRMAFSNSEELWEILRRRKRHGEKFFGDFGRWRPHFARRRKDPEVGRPARGHPMAAEALLSLAGGIEKRHGGRSKLVGAPPPGILLDSGPHRLPSSTRALVALPTE